MIPIDRSERVPHGVGTSPWSTAVLTLGFSCFWAWETTVIYAPGLLDSTESIGSTNWYINSIFVSVIYLTIFLASGILHPRINARWVALTALGCALFGSLLLIAISLTPSVPLDRAAIRLTANSFVALATVLLAILLMSVLSRHRDAARRSFVVLGGGAFGLALYVVISGLPIALLSISALLLPIAAVICLFVINTSDTLNVRLPEAKQARVLPYWLLCVLFIFAFAINFIRSSLPMSVSDTGVFSVVTLLVMIVFVLNTILERLSKSSIIHYSVMVLVTAVVFLNVFHLITTNVISILSISAFFIYVALLYNTISDYVAHNLYNGVRVISACLTANCIGLVLGGQIAIYFAGQQRVIAVVSILISYGIVVAGTAYFSRIAGSRRHTALDEHAIVNAAVSTHIAGDDTHILDIIRSRCEEFTNTYGLTKREREVMYRLSLGKTLHTISEELHLSVNTVKSHQLHIYQKLKIHTREQLLNEILGADDPENCDL
ncbi:MAG: LuxR family transcriptional regulator [Coriobacteriia bacterium]|nr:LuxR family transcriptional regulator [Coriobacteriia bacterium]